MAQLVEPQIETVLRRYKGDSLNPKRRGNERTDMLAWELLRAVEPLAQTEGERTFASLWFSVPRGSIDEWMTFEEYRDDVDEQYWDYAEKPTVDEAAWRAEWLDWFPEETSWHELEVLHDVVRGEDWLVVGIDNTTFCEVFPEGTIYERYFKQPRYDAPDLDNALLALADIATQTVDELNHGSYGPRIEKELPYDLRYGLIRRSDFWVATEGAGRFGCDELPKEELGELISALRNQSDEDELPALGSLTARHYFDALRNGYRACGYELEEEHEGRGSWLGIPKGDSREWHLRFGDARDKSLFELDPDSPEAFEDWFRANEHRLDHNFEIFVGRGCTRVHMNPYFADSGGWRLGIWGSITWHAADMAHMWKHMNKAGLPTHLYDAAAVANALEGSDYLLIVPRHKPHDYVSGEHFGHNISTALPLWREHREAIVAATHWQPIEIPRLSGERE